MRKAQCTVSQNKQGCGMVASKYPNLRGLTQLKPMQVEVPSSVVLLGHLEHVALEVMPAQERKMHETYQLLPADSEVIPINCVLI